MMNFDSQMALLFRCLFERDMKAKEQLVVFCEDQNWISREATNPIVEYAKTNI